MDESVGQIEWRRWLAAQAPRFLLFARQHARVEADAQDLVQEAIVEAHQRQGGQSPPASALVFAIIRCRAIDLARSAARRDARESACATECACWFDVTPEEREEAVLIHEAMKKLPDIYRETITLKVWGELTFAEIAHVVGISANTAASRYRYGLEELRKLARTVLT
jgi:RNA polymerase sigma-70 factor (ECF subfamily)